MLWYLKLKTNILVLGHLVSSFLDFIRDHSFITHAKMFRTIIFYPHYFFHIHMCVSGEKKMKVSENFCVDIKSIIFFYLRTNF